MHLYHSITNHLVIELFNHHLIVIQSNCDILNRYVKDLVIGSNRQKGIIIDTGIVPRLINILIDENFPVEIHIEAVLTICSLAKGTDDHIKALISSGVIPIALAGTNSKDNRYVEACLRCIRSIFKSSNSPAQTIYEESSCLIPHILSLASPDQSMVNKECVANIFASSCQVITIEIIKNLNILIIFSFIFVFRLWNIKIH